MGKLHYLLYSYLFMLQPFNVIISMHTQTHIYTYSTVNPQQLTFATIAPEGEIQTVQDLGPDFTTTFVVSTHCALQLQ